MTTTATNPNETTETTETTEQATEATEAEQRQQAETNVAQKFAEIFGPDSDADTPLTSEDDTSSEDDEEHDEEHEEPADTESETEDEDTEEDAEGEDDEQEAAADDDQQPSDAPTLPDPYRRSLKAYGWEDDEINANLRQLGDSFIKTAERIHQNRNTELQEWAKAGRQARKSGEEGQEGSDDASAQSGTQTDASSGGLQKLNPVDADKLKEQYGDDEIIDAIVGPVNSAINTMNQMIPQLQQGQQAAQQAEVERVSKQVEEFFGDEAMQPYTDLYGDSSQGLTDEQLEYRNKVLDTAYDMMMGASTLRNQNLPLQDALSYAHEVVTKDHQQAAARKSVKKAAKQRNRGITQKPSTKKPAADKSGESADTPPTREELERRTRDRLRQAFQS